MKNVQFILGAILTLIFTTSNISVAQNQNRIKEITEHLKNPSGEYVLVVSHRGDWTYAPENSIEAVQRCIDLGVDIVEIDVRLTKDGHLVAMHDYTVDRTTNGKGKVSDLTLEEIKQLRLKSAIGVKGSQITVPTLEEIMLVAKDKIMINLDKTEGATVRKAYEVLKKTETVDHAIFKANNSMEEMRKKYGALMDSIIFMPKLWYENEDVVNHLIAYETDIDPFVYETLFDSQDAETFKLLPQLDKQGDSFMAICLWDELCGGYTDENAILKGNEATYGWLIEHGADAIMTDRPQFLIEYLRSKGVHK